MKRDNMVDQIRTERDVEQYLSSALNTNVSKAETVDSPSTGDTLLYVDNNGATEAYIAEGAIQNTLAGNVDEIEEYGVLVKEGASATANKYDSTVADNVTAMLDGDIAIGKMNFQKRNESTNVNLEPKREDGFVRRALEHGPSV